MKHAIKYMALFVVVVLLAITLYFNYTNVKSKHDATKLLPAPTPAPVPVASKFSGSFDPRADHNLFESGSTKYDQNMHVPGYNSDHSDDDSNLADIPFDLRRIYAAYRRTAENALSPISWYNKLLGAYQVKYGAAPEKPAPYVQQEWTPLADFAKTYTPAVHFSMPDLYPEQVGHNVSDIAKATDSFATTDPADEQPDIVSTIAITKDLSSQHRAYMARNAGKFLIASQQGLVEDVDIVPLYGLRTYTCFQLQEDPSARQVSSLDLSTTNCRSRKYSTSSYTGS